MDYKALFESIPIPTWVFDPVTLRFLAVNDAAITRYGYARDEFLALTLEDIRPVEDLQRFREEVRDTTGLSEYHGQWRHRTKSGEEFDVEIDRRAVVFGGRHTYVVVAKDITVRREAERKLRETHEQLRRVWARARARREEDRTRVARELHDQLGQALAATKIGLMGLRDRLLAPSDEVTDQIGSMLTLVDDTIRRVRRISSDLRPGVLDRLGLAAAIQWQAREFERRMGIRTRVRSLVDPVDLDRGRSTAVFRIFEETLSNVATHAHASAVTVALSTSEDCLVLEIEDNGRGIGADAVNSGKSLGLMGMRERAELLGGTLGVAPSHPAGTVVTVRVPLTDRRSTPREGWA